jgi:anti-anti-sigma factor
VGLGNRSTAPSWHGQRTRTARHGAPQRKAWVMSGKTYFEVERHGGAVIVHLMPPEAFDRLLVHEAAEALINFVKAEGPNRLIVDFEQLAMCNSEMLGGLLAVRQHLLSIGGQMSLCALSPDLSEVFRVARLDGVFLIYPTLPEALAAG